MRFTLLWRHIFSLILVGSMTGAAIAQGLNKIDSLKKRLPGLHGIERFETLKQLFYLYGSYDYSKMYEVSEDALSTALKGTDSLLIVRAYRMKGNALTQLADNVRAISMYKMGLEIVKRNYSDPKIKDQEKYILNSIALSYLELGTYNKALDYNYLSLEIRQKEENEEDVSISLNNLGLVYYRLNDYQKAIECYAKSLLIRKRLGLNEDYDKLILVNLALCYIGLDDLEKALVYGKKVLTSCRSGCSTEVEREANTVIGQAYLMRKELGRAKLYLNQSLSIAKNQNDVSAIVINMINLSKVDLAGGHTRRALVHLHEAEQVIKDVEYPIVMLKIYQAFVDTYQVGGDKLQASAYQGKYLQLKDEIFSKGVVRDLSTRQLIAKDNEQTIDESTDRLNIGENRMNRQTLLISVTLIASLLMVGVSVFLIVSNRRNKDMNASLVASKKDTMTVSTKEILSISESIRFKKLQ